MPDNARDLHDRFAGHVFKHEQERIVQRSRVRWYQFVSLFSAFGITGYSQRSLVEAAFSRMKRLFGSRLFSKKIDAQRVENRLRCMLLNLFAKGKANTFGDFASQLIDLER